MRAARSFIGTAPPLVSCSGHAHQKFNHPLREQRRHERRQFGAVRARSARAPPRARPDDLQLLAGAYAGDRRSCKFFDVAPELRSISAAAVGREPQAKVNEYALAMKDYATFPPIECVEVDGVMLLTNGFHRVEAKKRIGETTIAAQVHVNGTYQDAQDAAIRSLRANSYGGIKHTNADKRKAVSMALRMERHRDKSDRMIAEMCGVDHEFVRNSRAGGDRRHLTFERPALPKKRVGKDGKRYPAERRIKPKREPFKPTPLPRSPLPTRLRAARRCLKA
jgi:hypothetical protein